jgi:hypothetical protein
VAPRAASGVIAIRLDAQAVADRSSITRDESSRSLNGEDAQVK